MAHPPRSKPPLRSSSGPPNPCITPSTETLVVVVNLMSWSPHVHAWCAHEARIASCRRGILSVQHVSDSARLARGSRLDWSETFLHADARRRCRVFAPAVDLAEAGVAIQGDCVRRVAAGLEYEALRA